MATETVDADDRERRVNLAIYDYHAAVGRGESPDPEPWTADHPEIADELSAYFDDLKALDLLRPSPPDAGEVGWTLVGSPDLEPGDVLGGYILLEKLGEGGQGVVWKASPGENRSIVVALKTLPGPASEDPVAISRLREDADAIARMRHPNIIRTSYFGEDRGRWFFVMELMEGKTVADRLDSYRADPRSAVVLIEKVARAIHHAHTRIPGVSHLDLKPSNILLTLDGEPRVADFGVSVRFKTVVSPEVGTDPPDAGLRGSAEEVAATISRLGMRGTIPYMSPEMAEGRWSSDVSPASDIYGLGAVLYAMLAGRPPFLGKDRAETLDLVIRGESTPPRDLNRRVDRELDAICRKCLDRDPAMRYGSADAMANDLRRWLEGRPSLAGGKPSAARELRFWARRHPRGVALAAVAAVAAWLASLAGSVDRLRAEVAHDSARLAGQVDRELRLIRRATRILADDPRLRWAFAARASGPAGSRQGTLKPILDTAVDKENLFGITGGNPFINVFILGPDGVLLADTLDASPAIGKDFRVRDYYRFFRDGDRPRDYVYIARSFRSVKDGRHKIAVSTRIWDARGDFLGYLVANFTIGPGLIDVNLRQEPDASVLCPVDRSDPTIPKDDPSHPWRYISVLDGRYASGRDDGPIEVNPSRLRDFEDDSGLDHVADRTGDGKLVDYRRVGETHLVVATTRACPWPLSWLPRP